MNLEHTSQDIFEAEAHRSINPFKTLVQLQPHFGKTELETAIDLHNDGLSSLVSLEVLKNTAQASLMVLDAASNLGAQLGKARETIREGLIEPTITWNKSKDVRAMLDSREQTSITGDPFHWLGEFEVGELTAHLRMETLSDELALAREQEINSRFYQTLPETDVPRASADAVLLARLAMYELKQGKQQKAEELMNQAVQLHEQVSYNPARTEALQTWQREMFNPTPKDLARLLVKKFWRSTWRVRHREPAIRKLVEGYTGKPSTLAQS